MPLSGFGTVLAFAVLVFAVIVGRDVGRCVGQVAVILGGNFSRGRLKSMALSRLPDFTPSSVYVCGRAGIAIDDKLRKLAVTWGRSSDILDLRVGIECTTEERRFAGWDWYYICLRKNGREFAIPFQDSRVRDEWMRKIGSLGM